MSCSTFLRRIRSVRKELLLIALLISIGHTDFAAAQSLAPASVEKSSQLDLKGLTKKADSGNTESQFQLGLAYQFGKGVNKDLVEAIKWYRVAANHGDPAAQNNLGYIYQTGPKAVRDLSEASRWYMRAASDGNPAAQVNLGLLYLRGEGVKKSPEDALHWINRAAETEYPTAMAALASLYATGQDVPQDLDKAVKLVHKAVKKHSPEAQALLGVFYARGLGVPIEASKVWTPYDDGEQISASKEKSRTSRGSCSLLRQARLRNANSQTHRQSGRCHANHGTSGCQDCNAVPTSRTRNRSCCVGSGCASNDSGAAGLSYGTLYGTPENINFGK